MRHRPIDIRLCKTCWLDKEYGAGRIGDHANSTGPAVPVAFPSSGFRFRRSLTTISPCHSKVWTAVTDENRQEIGHFSLSELQEIRGP